MSFTMTINGKPVQAEEGEMVLGTQMTMGTQLMAVADLSRMEVEVDVDETDVVAVAVSPVMPSST